MATSAAQVRDLLFPGLNAIISDYPMLPAQWSDIFDKYTSEMASERDVELKLLGLAQGRAEGQAVAYEDMGERNAFVYKWTAVALGFILTKFAIRDNLYKQAFGPSTRALKRSFQQTKEVLGANVLNNAADTSGANNGGDGVPLLSTLHPIDVGTVANTFSVQAELSETALQDAVNAIRAFRDAAGLKVMLQGRRLIIAPQNQFVAQRLLRTELRVGTSDNDTNAFRQMGFLPEGYFLNDFLTNTRAWFIKTNCDDGLKYFQRDPFETDMTTDFDTDNLKTKASERYGFGWSNFRAVFGCTP